MKVFCLTPRENWFCDRYGLEYQNYSRNDVSLDYIYEDTSVIWLLASWCFKNIPDQVLASKKVICTIHHEVPWKFDENRALNFKNRDRFVDAYHVPCDQTKDFVETITDKPVYKIGYWCNNHLWKEIKERRNR